MDTNDGKPKIIDGVNLQDESDLSPEKRAEKVLSLLQQFAPDLKEWDLICFAANYLGYISASYPWLEESAKRACVLVYTAHYLDNDTNIATGIKSNARDSGT